MNNILSWESNQNTGVATNGEQRNLLFNSTLLCHNEGS